MNYFTKAMKAFIRGFNRPDNSDIEYMANGSNGRIELYANKICIKKEGLITLMAEGLKGEKNIMISTISSIQFKKAGLMNGYIQFTFMGSQEAKKGMLESITDENSIIFTSGQQKSFEKLKDMIEKRIETKNAPTDVATSSLSSADEIMKFANLRDKGVITEDEFIQKKKEFLGL